MWVSSEDAGTREEDGGSTAVAWWGGLERNKKVKRVCESRLYRTAAQKPWGKPAFDTLPRT